MPSALLPFVEANQIGTEPGATLHAVWARDLVMRLPDPVNVKRDPDLIPHIPVKILLATERGWPERIRERVRGSVDEELAHKINVGGLCLNGRGQNPSIFVNRYALLDHDPSGAIIDETLWHEYVHGAEDHGLGHRPTPWSYVLQQNMLALDVAEGHAGRLKNGKIDPDFVNYVRQGTILQDHVSEIFTRVAEICLNEVRVTGLFPDTPDAVYGLISPDTMIENARHPHASHNYQELHDLLIALSSYGRDANTLFWNVLPEMVGRLGLMYGCRLPKIQLSTP